MNYLGKLTLVDYFDRMFKILGKTWKTTLAVSVVVYAVITLFSQLTTQSMNGAIEMLRGMEGKGAEALPSIFRSMGNLYAVVAAVLAITMVASAFIEVVGAYSAWRAANGEDASLRASFVPALKKHLLSVVLQSLCLTFGLAIALYILVLAVAIPGGIAIAGFSAAGNQVGVTVATVVMAVVIFVLALAYLVSMFFAQFAPTVCVVEGKSAFQAISRLIALVKPRFWRSFGIAFLMTLAIAFAVGLVTAPLSFALMVPYLKDVFELLKEEGASGLMKLGERIAGMSTVLAIGSAVSGTLGALLTMPFKALYVIDHKARLGDFEPVAEVGEDPLFAPPTDAETLGETESGE